MSVLHRKLLRDLWQIRGQALAISLVIAAGVATFIMSLATYESLRLTQETYYQRYRFADVFARALRAPLRLESRIAQIPGVESVETRVIFDVTLDIAGLSEPVVGRLISVPDRRAPRLNDIALLNGRYLDPDRPGEALINQGFAEARGLGPGDSVTAIINGRRQQLEIVGIALSPEYVYTIRPGEMLPDEGRFGLFWISREALATAFDMEGGFNDVALSLTPPISGGRSQEALEHDVITHLDRLLEPYGGLGAVPRARQVSHWWLADQLAQLRDMGVVIPVIFLTVAAFLLSVVLGRIVAVQRGQIAALKALGYSNLQIGSHYFGWGLAIALCGGLLGVAAGVWMATGMIEIQNNFFRFPVLHHHYPPSVVLGAISISILAALIGATSAVRRAVSLPPAEAMRPETPAGFGRSWLERLAPRDLWPQPARMVLRNLERNPLRTAASITGIAAAAAILILGMFSISGMDEMLDVQFNIAQRQDVTVSFVQPLSAHALHEIERLPGVISGEALRSVPVRFEAGHRSRQGSITGLTRGARLQRIIDASKQPVTLPQEGLVLSTQLAKRLEVARGELLTLEVLEGPRPVREVMIADLVDESMGLSAYMEAAALHRLMREGPSVSGAFLAVDSAHVDELFTKLKSLPAVAGVTLKSAAIENFDKMIRDFLGVSIFFNVLFAGVIAFGVVYNTARISLSERSRELASLRVMGFSRGEISFVLLGELAFLTLTAIPLGLAFGYGLAGLTVSAFETEVYRVPLIVSRQVYGFSALTILLAATLSGLWVRRRLDRLDLVEVLKTRES